jgi:hypothetical protein
MQNVESRKASSSILGEVTEFFSIYLIILAALGPAVHWDSNRTEYQKKNIYILGE